MTQTPALPADILFNVSNFSEFERAQVNAYVYANRIRDFVLRIHPDDAAERGIADGDVVRIFNDRGEIRLPAQLTDSVRAGVVAVPQGRSSAVDGVPVNVLTHDDVTDIGYGAIYFDCLVQVEPDSE